jgi:hypothetical protein
MDPISVLIRATDLLNELPANGYLIELDTDENKFVLEKATQWYWSVDTEDDTIDTETGAPNNTKYVNHLEIITFFYRDYIKRISIRKHGVKDDITLYQLK